MDANIIAIESAAPSDSLDSMIDEIAALQLQKKLLEQKERALREQVRAALKAQALVKYVAKSGVSAKIFQETRRQCDYDLAARLLPHDTYGAIISTSNTEKMVVK